MNRTKSVSSVQRSFTIAAIWRTDLAQETMHS